MRSRAARRRLGALARLKRACLMQRRYHWRFLLRRKTTLAHGSLGVRRPNPRSTEYLWWMSIVARRLRRRPAPMAGWLFCAQWSARGRICSRNWGSRPAIFSEHVGEGVVSTSTCGGLGGGSDRIVEVPCVPRTGGRYGWVGRRASWSCAVVRVMGW